MTRATIMLPKDIKTKATLEARKLIISFADFVRQAIADKLRHSHRMGNRIRNRRADPIFRLMDDPGMLIKASATDIAKNHDDYLYGDKAGDTR